MAGFDNTIVFSKGEKLQTSTSLDITRMQTLTSDVSRINFQGSPNGAISANPSSLCHDPASGFVYTKATGTGNTGWQQIGGELTSPPIGSLSYFANANGDTYATTAGWLKCNGQIVSQATYSVLFSRMGLINPPGITWTSRSSTTTSTINALTFGNSLFMFGNVNAGSTGASDLYTSTNAISWATSSSPIGTPVNALTFGAGKFVYADNQGSIGTSTDGIKWNTQRPSVGPNTANSNTKGPFLVTNGSTYLVTPLFNGSIQSSTDFINWSTVVNNNTINCGGLAFGAGVFCAMYSSGGASTAGTSTDGITWSSNLTGVSATVNMIQFTNDLFISNGASQNLIASTDGVTWTSHVTGMTSGNNVIGAAFNTAAGVYLISGASNSVVSSTDLVTYTSRNTAGASCFIASDQNIFVCAKTLVGTAGLINTSTDGITYTARTSNTSSSIQSLIYANNLFLYGTNNGGIGTSTDGVTWVARTSGVASNILTLTYNGSVYLGGGCNFLISSTDGTTWTTVTSGYSGTFTSINALTYGGGEFVFGGNGGILSTSTDAVTWTARTSNTASNILSLTFGTNYVYGAASGGMASSTDGITWTPRTSQTASNINALVYGSLYVLAASGGGLNSSTDAITWTTLTSPTASSLNALAYNAGVYIAAGNGGVTLESTDGTNWYSRTSSTTSNLLAATSGLTVFVEAGVNGALQTSTNAYAYDTTTQFQIPNDAQLGITTESTTNFFRSLYIKALIT